MVLGCQEENLPPILVASPIPLHFRIHYVQFHALARLFLGQETYFDYLAANLVYLQLHQPSVGFP